MRLEEQRRIRRPVEEVFSYLADFSNSAEWDPGVTRAARLDQGPIGPGSRFEVEVEFGGTTSPMTYEIVEYEPDRRVVLAGKGSRVDARDDIRVRSEGDVTVVDYRADLRFHGLLGLVAPLLAPYLRRKVAARALDGLAATLQ